MSTETFVKPRRRDVDDAIYGIANGEEEALENLYKQTSGAVFAYALAVTKNLFDAQDVMQNTYIKVYEAAPGYISKGKPMSWLMRIVHNLCFDRFRSGSRTVELTEQQLNTVATEDADPIDKLVISSVLNKLNDEERSIVVMHAVGGMKHREISKELALPLNTVLSKYNRAIAKLRNILQGERS